MSVAFNFSVDAYELGREMKTSGRVNPTQTSEMLAEYRWGVINTFPLSLHYFKENFSLSNHHSNGIPSEVVFFWIISRHVSRLLLPGEDVAIRYTRTDDVRKLARFVMANLSEFRNTFKVFISSDFISHILGLTDPSLAASDGRWC